MEFLREQIPKTFEGLITRAHLSSNSQPDTKAVVGNPFGKRYSIPWPSRTHRGPSIRGISAGLRTITKRRKRLGAGRARKAVASLEVYGVGVTQCDLVLPSINVPT